ncbi:hypothetical protein [Rhodopirellula bahusiensis]|uniref:MarR family transcriptional regulator n=1 Tax=Rhodopirellula bahusiensis TaxID=2014065 RepID=A0A2G1W096_9BACT|nr:hypothetical protein [Rhodopirellula bahusiensis]PHQ32453.1 hypothetical protein CEE69_25325 [Rhodopirellula bahusiensis]
MIDDLLQTSSETLPLFDHGQHAKATKAEAYQNALPLMPGRMTAFLKALHDAGRPGLTREEGGDALGVPQNCINSVALKILREGLAVETGERRKTKMGATAAVMVHVDHLDGGGK